MNNSLIAALVPLMLHNLTSSSSGNESHGASNHPVITEGGFLTGRNPFLFIQSVPLPTFIVQLVVIVCASRIVKLILAPIKQPAVIAETISGIILGPTVMGHIPYFSETIFYKPSLPFLSLMSNFGLVLFLFLVGLELDPRMLKKSMKNSLAISLTGMALPFAMGAGVSWILYVYVEPASHQNGFVKYFLFLGVAMAITAFPVLARILTELHLLKTKVGSVTIAAAAVDDATSWCLLALVISLINAGPGLIALYVFLMGLGYSLLLIFIVRPVFVRLLRRSGAFEGTPSQFMMFLTLMIVWISAFITDAIGIHAIFGGFLAGIIMPHEGGFAYHITEKLEDIVAILFLPLYFALSGLRTSIGSLDDPLSWGIVILVIFVACFGKIFGCTLAARSTQMSWRESFTVGCLMNCKGLVELIVLNLGYDAGVISEKVFAIMVIMALVTTFITVPLVSFIYPPIYHEKPEERPSKKKKGPPSLLVCVNKLEQVPSILSVIHLLQCKLNPDNRKIHRKGSGQSQGSAIVPILGTPVLGEKAGKLKTGVVINSLRLIELTERDSSVMLQTSQDALSQDPVTQMLRTCCSLDQNKSCFRSLVKVVTLNRFGETVVNTAEQVDAKYILVPWSGSGSLIEDLSVRPIQQAFTENRRRQSFHTPIQHANFLQDLMAGTPCTCLVLVDRGLDVTTPSILTLNSEQVLQAYHQIYFPYFGGPDDREALEIVLSLAAVPNVNITITRYRNMVNRKLSSDSSAPSTVSEDTIAPQEILVLDSADDEILNHYFGLQGKEGRLGNIAFSEVEAHNPITTALQYMKELSSTDLVVIGRGNTRLHNSVNFKNADAERRKVLGDLAESVLLCPCDASVLVVQANRLRIKCSAMV